MINREELLRQRIMRAEMICSQGSPAEAVEKGLIEQFQDITVNEALVLGLLNQGVKKYFAVFGHGSTDLAEVLRVYQEYSLVKVFNLRSEVEASHAASMLRWQFGEHSAVVTSIGPGALHALSGSLVAQSNGLGVYYIFGDETTHQEGPNMQQIPKREQDLYLKLADVMGRGFSLTEGYALPTALKWAWQTTHDPAGERPFYLLLPMNVQARVLKHCNLLELPGKSVLPRQCCADPQQLKTAADLIRQHTRITVKIGRGASGIASEILKSFVERCSAVLVHSPHIPGMLAYDDPLNMSVGGSKGSLCGNYAMENCELLIAVGARGVCQWDSSGTAWKKVQQVININSNPADVVQYNRSVALLGDAQAVILQLTALLEAPGTLSEWQETCTEYKRSWNLQKQAVYKVERLPDPKWGREVLTQPAAIHAAASFADSIGAVKIFDAGDVQANGFQTVEDSSPGMTVTETGASYMGFAVSSLIACGTADAPRYGIAFTGDGSFFMNPQVLIDGSELGTAGMILVFDNRRMAAISNLQIDQYAVDFATDDQVAVDYASLADTVSGVRGFFGGTTREELLAAMKKAYEHQGLSVVHIPVYFGPDEAGSLGVFGSWNVGNWCEEVEAEKHKIGL